MPRTTNYALRSRVFQLDETEKIYRLYKLYRRVEHCKDYGLSMPEEYHPEINNDDFEFLQAFYPAEWAECEKIYTADKSRSYRLKIKVRYMLTLSKCRFLTLTFTDAVLASTSEHTRRQYVRRWLASLDCAYIANVDYGSENNREHYHALVACRPTDKQLADWIFNYGALYSQPVRPSLGSTVRLSKYVSKLTNHAVKVTTRRTCLLFSRKHPLPSTYKELYNNVTLILDKGYVLRIENTVNTSKKGTYRVLKPSRSNNSSLLRRCTVCGSIIPVLPSQMKHHTLTRQIRGKSKKFYYCSECIRELKIKTDAF